MYKLIDLPKISRSGVGDLTFIEGENHIPFEIKRVYYADFMKKLALRYPEAETISLVQDNLNTHTAGSFYEALPPEEAFKLARSFEFHFTPKKGSWLNMAEIELSALSKQCLDRRIADLKTLKHEVSAWENERNSIGATVRSLPPFDLGT